VFSPKIYFFDCGFGRYDLYKLLISIGEFPIQSTFCFKKFKIVKQDRSLSSRKEINFNFKCLNTHNYKFEKYISSIIISHLPIFYVEGYVPSLTKIKGISIKPKLIVTSFGHWYNDLFKLWHAELSSAGSKLVAIQHGNSLNDGYKCQFEFENRISDYRITAGTPYEVNELQLPFLKVRQLVKSINASRDNRICGIVGYETTRYAFRADNGPLSSQSQVVFNHSISFYEELDEKIKKSTKIRPYPSGWWNTPLQYKNRLGEEKIATENTYYKFIKKCKLVVITYPLTAFGESMCSGVPTILIYSRDLWGFSEIRRDLMGEMEKAGIIFSDEKLAAKHINLLWENIDEWWNSEVIKKIRERFLKEVMQPPNSRSLQLWSSTLRKLANEDYR
jgi:putative transferase (TIGR04331 family)